MSLDSVDALTCSPTRPRRPRRRLPLSAAVESRRADIVKYLLDLGDDPSKQWGAVLHASSQHCCEIIQLLLQRGTNPTISLLKKILRVGCARCVRELQDHGARLPSCAMIKATSSGSADLVSYLLEQGAPLMPQRGLKKSPLHFAAKMGHLEVCEVLLQAGALQNVDRRCRTPVMYAAANDWPRVVELLLRNGGFVDDKVLELSLRHPKSESLRIVLQYTNSVTLKTSARKEDALDVLINRGSVRNMRVLLKEDSRDQLLYESCFPYSLEAFLMLLNYLVNDMFAVLLVKSPVCVYSSCRSASSAKAIRRVVTVFGALMERKNNEFCFTATFSQCCSGHCQHTHLMQISL